jgi:hypothetical protein
MHQEPDLAEFGVLTLATPNDYLKAIGLALSLRVSNPGIPVAVACAERLRPLLAPHFDLVIGERSDLRGFVHKIYLDEYSPFSRTLFLDSDVLVFKSVGPYVSKWAGRPYTACGVKMTGGVSHFGLDRKAVIDKLGLPFMYVIDGAGHAYFEKPDCQRLFDKARELTANYRELAGPIRYADEDVVAIAMTLTQLEPVAYEDFFAMFLSARPGTMEMDAAGGRCRFIAINTGEPFEPCMVHFMADGAPGLYAQQLIALFRKFGLPWSGVLKMAAGDLYRLRLKDHMYNRLKQARKLLQS